MKKKKINIYTLEVITGFMFIVLGFIAFNLNDNLATILILLGFLDLIFAPILTLLFKLQSKKKKETIELTQGKTNNNDWIFKRKDFAFNEKEHIILINNHKYNFNDIIDFELLIDDNTISKTDTSSALTRTLLFGDIIGGTTAKKKSINYCTQLKIKITVDNLSNPVEYINFMNGFTKLKKDSFMYKKISESANECLSLLTIITNKKEQ